MSDPFAATFLVEAANSFSTGALVWTLPLPEVHHLKFHSSRFHYMSRPERVGVNVVNVVGMEKPWQFTTQDGFLARRIGQPVCSPVPTMRCVALARRADDRDAFRQHHLIASMSMQVSAAHEASLSWVSVDPPENHEILRIHIIKQLRLVRHLACV